MENQSLSNPALVSGSGENIHIGARSKRKELRQADMVVVRQQAAVAVDGRGASQEEASKVLPSFIAADAGHQEENTGVPCDADAWSTGG